MRSQPRYIFITALIAGTMDITAAIIQTLIGGGNIMRLMQYIASGMFGKQAFEGGMTMAALGLLFHYIIAMGWTWLYAFIYPKNKLLQYNWMLSAVIYGLAVWFLMNRVVLQLSNVTPFPFNITRALIAAGILVVCIGGPIAYRIRGDK
ncbi:MAG: hypothetical protein JST14_04610 [Bacteroidetes bacterium]|nr:hypothetical protein [Bacteroidota bacterium]